MRYRAIIALLLITQLMCLGCSGSLGGVLNTQEGWSDAQVYQYFDKQSDIFGFSSQLKADGYKYIKIPFVILPTYDGRISPNNTLANGGGNCAAYCKLYEGFIEYKRCADNYYEYQMVQKSLDNHMILVIRIADSYYEVSNLNLTQYPSKEIILDKWRKNGYNFIDESKVWNK